MAGMVTIKVALDYAIKNFDNYKIFILTYSLSSIMSINNGGQYILKRSEIFYVYIILI